MTTAIQVLFPTGRVVQGSLYKGQDKDGDGKPLLVKSGPNIGKPTIKYFFSVAIPKTSGVAHWASETWGAPIWALAHSSWPQGQAQAPTFAFKIEDGDSTIPNKKGKKNADRVGFPGNWVVNFTSGFAPRIFNSNGSQALPDADAVKLGYYIQVQASVDSNRSDTNPGLYINHNMVAFQGFGQEIHVGPDAASVGFGAGPAPVGMSVAPVGGMPAPGAPAPAAYQPPPPAAGAPAPYVAPAPAPTAVAPAPSYIAPPGPPAAPPAPPAAPAAGPVLTALARGATYAQMLAAGWTDDTLRANGMMA